MRKWSLILLLGMFFVFPNFVFAQSNLTLTNLSVQLWPEFDQPSMLVITDFEVPVTTLPVDLTFRIPKDANLIAVASTTNGIDFLTEPYDALKVDGEWQVFTMKATQNIVYRFEYYQPITFNGKQRIFSYLWDGEYAVDAFDIRVLEPVDTTSLTTTPKLASIEQKDGLKYFHGDPVKLANGEQFALNLEYQKSSDALIVSTQGVQPAAPVDENTPGRVSLNNTLPYLIGGLGVIMIVGGLVYYLRSGRNNGAKKSRHRQHANAEESETDVYCAQCGTRARSGDRFCRTCGARIRHQEE